MKIQRFIQYAYLAISIFFLYEAYTNWTLDRDRSYMLLLFAALALFMYFFKKRFAKKFDDKSKN